VDLDHSGVSRRLSDWTIYRWRTSENNHRNS